MSSRLLALLSVAALGAAALPAAASAAPVAPPAGGDPALSDALGVAPLDGLDDTGDDPADDPSADATCADDGTDATDAPDDGTDATDPADDGSADTGASLRAVTVPAITVDPGTSADDPSDDSADDPADDSGDTPDDTGDDCAADPLAPATKLATVLSTGVYDPGAVDVTGPATVAQELVLGSGTAHARRVRLGRAVRRVRRAGRVSLKIKLTKNGRKALRRASAGGRVRVTLRTTIRPKHGRRTVRTRAVTLKR